jgi:hypothetical protein
MAAARQSFTELPRRVYRRVHWASQPLLDRRQRVRHLGKFNGPHDQQINIALGCRLSPSPRSEYRGKHDPIRHRRERGAKEIWSTHRPVEQHLERGKKRRITVRLEE